MAIYHLSPQIIERSKGRSSVAASAYRAGEKIEDERTREIHDYTRKTGIIYKEILTPINAPEWANDRARLWNEVEKIEKSKNSQLAREFNGALPRELSREQQIELTRTYIKENFVDKGMVADFAIHDINNNNPHFHVMLTMRPFNEDGTWGAKCKKEYMLDTNGEKIKLKSGEYKSRKIDTTDWNQKETLLKWREQWANYANKALEKAGCDERIDHRTLQAQGIDREPQIHVGAVAIAMEKRTGEVSEKRIRNNEIKELNRRIEEIKKESIVYLQEYKELKADKNSAIEAEKQELESSINTISAKLQVWDEQIKIHSKANWNLIKCGIFEIAEKKRLKAIVDKVDSILDSTGYNVEKYEKLRDELKDKINKLNGLNDPDKKLIANENGTNNVEVEKQRLEIYIKYISTKIEKWDKQLKIIDDCNYNMKYCYLDRAEEVQHRGFIDKAKSVLKETNYDEDSYDDLKAELKEKVKKLNDLKDLDKKPIVKKNIEVKTKTENVEVKKKVEYVDHNIDRTVSKTLNAVTAISSGRGRDEDRQAEEVVTIGATMIGGVLGAAKKIQEKEKENLKVAAKVKEIGNKNINVDKEPKAINEIEKYLSENTRNYVSLMKSKGEFVNITNRLIEGTGKKEVRATIYVDGKKTKSYRLNDVSKGVDIFVNNGYEKVIKGVVSKQLQFKFDASLEDINIFKAIGKDSLSFKDLENLLKKEPLELKVKVFEKFFDMVDSKYLKEENMDIKGKERFVLTDKGKDLINKGIQGYKDYRDIGKEYDKNNKEIRHKSKNIDREER